MKLFRIFAGVAALMFASALPAASRPAPASAPAFAPVAKTQVMIFGTFHFDNPGLDYRNLKVDDPLKPGRQREIAAIVRGLARFAPTAVGVEWRDEAARTAYARYVRGDLPPSRDEAVQLGFALARSAHLDVVHGLDLPMQLPFEPVLAFAEKNKGQAIVEQITTVSDANVAAQDRTLKTRGMAATLLLLNDPVAAGRTHALYRVILKLGAGDDQPGLDATAMWYRRNLGICAKLLQAARPGDRMVVFFGAGHLTLLQQCVRETPGYELGDARDYLSR